MDFVKRFEKIKEKFSKIDTSKLNSDFAIQVNMTDEDCGGAFYVANIGGEFSVEPYDYVDHTAMVTATAGDFEKLIGRRIGFDTAVKNGKIVIDGNADDVLAMTELFPKPAKKPAAKKAAPKAEEKKEEVKAEPKKEVKAEVKKEVKPEVKEEVKPAVKPQVKAEEKPVAKKTETKKTVKSKK